MAPFGWSQAAPFILGGLGTGLQGAASFTQPEGDNLVGYPSSVTGYDGPPAYSGLVGTSLMGDAIQLEEDLIGMNLGRIARPLSLAGTAIDPAPIYRGPNMPVEIGSRSIDPAWLQPALLSRPGLNFRQEGLPEAQASQDAAQSAMKSLFGDTSPQTSSIPGPQTFPQTVSEIDNYFQQYSQQSEPKTRSGQCDPSTVATVNTCAHQIQNVPAHKYWKEKSPRQFSINTNTGACVEECYEFDSPQGQSSSPMTGGDDGSGDKDWEAWARDTIGGFLDNSMLDERSGTGPGAGTGPQTGAGSDPIPTGQGYSTQGRLDNVSPYLYGQELLKTENVYDRIKAVDQDIHPQHDPETSLLIDALQAIGVATDPVIRAGARANREDPRVDDKGFLTSGVLPNVLGGRPNVEGILPAEPIGEEIVPEHQQQFLSEEKPQDEGYDPLADSGVREKGVGHDAGIMGAVPDSDLEARIAALEAQLAAQAEAQLAAQAEAQLAAQAEPQIAAQAEPQVEVQRKAPPTPKPAPKPAPKPKKPACNAQTVATVNTCAGSPTARRLGWKSYPTPKYGPNRNGECVEHCIHPK
jgi:hypothetical protein